MILSKFAAPAHLFTLPAAVRHIKDACMRYSDAHEQVVSIRRPA